MSVVHACQHDEGACLAAAMLFPVPVVRGARAVWVAASALLCRAGFAVSSPEDVRRGSQLHCAPRTAPPPAGRWEPCRIPGRGIRGVNLNRGPDQGWSCPPVQGALGVMWRYPQSLVSVAVPEKQSGLYCHRVEIVLLLKHARLGSAKIFVQALYIIPQDLNPL